MEEKKDILLTLIEHPALLLDAQSIQDMKDQVTVSEDEDELDAFLDVLVEIIEKRTKIVSDLSKPTE